MDITEQVILIRNEHDFDTALQTHQRTIALFYAMWCPFCVRFLPVFEQAVQKWSKDLTFIMVEDQEPLEDRYSINVVPTVLFFQNGELAQRLDGKLGVGLTDRQLSDFLNTV